MNIVLLSGGSGKRLWPLSNDTMSKQFLKLLRSPNGEKESMVQRVFRQLNEVGIKGNKVIATGKSQVESIRSQLGDVDVVIEPERRNTFPAILLACAYLKYVKNVDKNESVIILPVDPYTDNKYFETLLKMDEVIRQDKADMTLMGIIPTYPSEKYGYIITDNNDSDVKNVVKFQEKPNLEKAKELLSMGAYWNAGVFGFKLKYIMDILDKNIKISSFDDLYQNFSSLKKDSFDYEVVEKANSINMIPYKGEWKDLGTWNTLSEEMPNNHGNVITGENNENTTVINVTDRPVVVLGLKNAVVVSSTEGVLVSDKEKSSYLKPYVENLSDRPLYERKRWGEYRVLEESIASDGEKVLTKHLSIEKGKSISLQLHHHRDEIWTVIDGEGELTLGEKVKKVSKGEVISITRGTKHKIVALTDMHIIETQIGEKLIEEDIERFD